MQLVMTVMNHPFIRETFSPSKSGFLTALPGKFLRKAPQESSSGTRARATHTTNTSEGILGPSVTVHAPLTHARPLPVGIITDNPRALMFALRQSSVGARSRGQSEPGWPTDRAFWRKLTGSNCVCEK